ncbi:unnamed protein product, partial [Prorocentrum cordatum]
LASVNLSSYQPTPEEIAAARAILGEAGSKLRHKQMGSMAHYLKNNQDEKVQNSRGAEREKYLEAYLAFQLKEKSASKKVTRTDGCENKKSKMTDVHWWSAHKVDQELGSAKGKHWRESNLLASRPDSLTGSADEQFVEWAVPLNWGRLSETVLKAMMLEFMVGAGEAEAAHLAEVAAGIRDEGTGAESSTGSTPAVKQELTETQKLEKRATRLQEELTPVLRKFQDILLESKVILTKVEGGPQKEKKMASVLMADLGKQIARAGRVTKILERLCVEKGNISEAMKLLSQIDECEKINHELKEWAAKFGFLDAPKASKRRRKGKQQDEDES